MKSSDYWRNRAKQSLSESFKDAEEVSSYMRKIYVRGAVFAVRQYKELVTPFIKNGELDVDALNKERVHSAAFQTKIMRAEEAIKEYSKRTGATELALTRAELKKVYADSYSSMMHDAGADYIKDAGNLYGLDDAALDKAITTPWTKDGREFSERIWANAADMNRRLRQTLSDGLLNGKSVQQMSQEFANTTGVSYNNCKRLVRTETNAIHTRAKEDSMEDLGIEYYEIVGSSDDEGEEANCTHFIGRHFRLDELEEGVNAPPFHPNCRCTTVPWGRWSFETLDFTDDGELTNKTNSQLRGTAILP